MGKIEDVEIVYGVKIVNDHYLTLCKVLLAKHNLELFESLVSSNSFESCDELNQKIKHLNHPNTWLGLEYELLPPLHTEMKDNPTIYDGYHETVDERESNVILFPCTNKDNIVEEQNKRYIKYYPSNNCIMLGVSTLVLNAGGRVTTGYSFKIVDIDCRDSLKLLLGRFFKQSDIDDIMTSYGSYIHY